MRVSRKSIGGISATSAAVHTAMTSALPRASAQSMAMMRPWACAERTTRIYIWCANEISAAKRPWPTTRGASSSRGTERPTKGVLPAMPISSAYMASLLIVLRGNGVEVLGFIDATDAKTGFIHVDLVDAARILCEPPVGRERQFQNFEQQGPVHTVMTDQHDGFIGMAREHHAQRIDRPRRQILQRFAVREAHQLRLGEPCRGQRGVLRLGFDKSFELPGAVIDIVEILAGFCGNAGRPRNRCRSCDAAAHRTGIDVAWSPPCGDALGQHRGLRRSALGELQRLAPAKSLRLDAFDMAVPGQDDFSHRGLFSAAPSCATRLGSQRRSGVLASQRCIRASTIIASSVGFCGELCRERRYGAMASIVWRSEPPQRQGPGEQCTHAGEGGDGEKSGAERLADLRM